MIKQKIFFPVLLLVVLATACQNPQKQEQVQEQVQAKTVEVIKFPQLQALIDAPGEQVKVINFWATWCRPCIKELPYFEALQKKHDPAALQVYLINLDDVEALQSKVVPFVEKRNMSSTIKLLDETDYNSFIDKVDPSWSGAIPATLIIAGDKRRFFEGELSADELQTIINEVSNL